jgi:hypothetical protein
MSDSITSFSDGTDAQINKHDLTYGGCSVDHKKTAVRTTPNSVHVIITKWGGGDMIILWFV